MKVSTTALAAALALSAAATPALAEQGAQPAQSGNRGQQQGQQGQQPQRRFNLSNAERTALAPLVTIDQAQQTARRANQPVNYAAAQPLLPAAIAAARGNDAKYVLSHVQLNMALAANDPAAQLAAVNALLANPSTPADEQTTLRNYLDSEKAQRATAAFNSGNFAESARLFRELAAAHPDNAAYRNNAAAAAARGGDNSAARDLTMESIRTAEAAGRPASAVDYRNAIALANQANDRDQAINWAAKLAQNYPTAANWHDAANQARVRLPQGDTQYLLDIYRLMHRARALQASAQINEYTALAEELSRGGLLGEARLVLQSGVDAGALRPDTRFLNSTVSATIADYQTRSVRDQASLATEARQARTEAGGRHARNIGDAYYGLDRYAEAADMYRVALGKSGEDANLLNTRLGMSLALAGQRAEAETAFRAVTGPRADLAKLWLAWLARSSAPAAAATAG